jgi:hypothetical protein
VCTSCSIDSITNFDEQRLCIRVQLEHFEGLENLGVKHVFC